MTGGVTGGKDGLDYEREDYLLADVLEFCGLEREESSLQ